MNPREAMVALLRRGAAVNVRDPYGKTPLHKVCSDGHDVAESMVELLLASGADETALTAYGKSPADLLDVSREVFEGDLFGDDDYEEPRLSQESIELLRVTLARAPADRAWRRRRWLCMLRARFRRRGSLGARLEPRSRTRTWPVPWRLWWGWSRTRRPLRWRLCCGWSWKVCFARS